MKIPLLVIILIHGAIHLMGFLHLSGLYKFSEFSGDFTIALAPGRKKIIGWLWLVAFFGWLCLAVFIFIGANPVELLIFTMLGSQLLIILQWKDAKFGTLANLLIPILIALFI
ncbi:MAG: hypothetical protein Kow0037_10790 [Calditrichia bacterium]